MSIFVDSLDHPLVSGVAHKQLGQLRHDGGQTEVLWRLELVFDLEPGFFVLRHGEFLRIHPAGRPPPLSICGMCGGRGAILGAGGDGEREREPAFDEVDLFDFLAARRGKQYCPICGGSGRIREC